MADKTDLSQLAEAELHRLKKQLREIQLELHVLLEEKLCQMKKEINIISVLQKEYGTLKDDISVYGVGVRKKVSQYNRGQHLSNLQNKLIANQKTIITEKIKLWELNGHLRKVHSDLHMTSHEQEQLYIYITFVEKLIREKKNHSAKILHFANYAL